MEKLEIIAESIEGLHITLASVTSEAHGAMVAEAIYQRYMIPRSGFLHIRYIWLRSADVYKNDEEPRNHHLLRAWPEAWQDKAGHEASLAAWRSSPRGVSGDESEPPLQTALHHMKSILSKLPGRYQPVDLTHEKQRYTLSVDHQLVFHSKPGREAIIAAQRYVEEHERAGWSLPTGVVNGIYD